MAHPTQHYNTVTEAWSHLLGEDLHYGYFTDPGQSLAQATSAMTAQMLASAALQPADTVLDVGCGSGTAGCRIAAEFGCQVTGISPSQACIEAANARVQALGLQSRAQFCLGNGMALAFADATFDCVWVLESSHLMLDKVALLAECSRVLKPGGRLVLCDIMASKPLHMVDVLQYRDEFLLLQAAFGRARMEPPAHYCQHLQERGLSITSCTDISAQTRPTFSHWRQNAAANRAAVIAALGEGPWQEFVDSCAVLEDLWEREVLGYGLIAASKSRDTLEAAAG